ncbi:hypothetical protein B0H14DRAFT_2589680 [Mycena olivaceomarginata]|nr:hypothetical protein B0H14DRAFT_2589680 [Mycena olivaceomarginata]
MSARNREKVGCSAVIDGCSHRLIGDGDTASPHNTTCPPATKTLADDAEIARILGELELQDASPPLPQLRPLLTPPATSFSTARRHQDSRALLPATPTRITYHYRTPTSQGDTTEWSTAGAAHSRRPWCARTGIPLPSQKENQNPRCGRLKPKLSSAGCPIAFSVATRRSPLHTPPSTTPTDDCGLARFNDASRQPIAAAALPLPITDTDTVNSLNSSEADDDTWYVVYRGIAPGVYRSHLECQLNTLGVSNSSTSALLGKPRRLRDSKIFVCRDNYIPCLSEYALSTTMRLRTHHAGTCRFFILGFITISNMVQVPILHSTSLRYNFQLQKPRTL